MAEEKEGVLFKRLDNPVEIRRTLLEASKQVVHGLQKYERLKAIRIKKAEQLSKLRACVRDISSLTANLKKDFPDIMFNKIAPKKEAPLPKKKLKVMPKGTEEKEPQQKENRGVHELEKQLADIEKKLSSIS